MSMPQFPEINPEMTCDNALNMILASIAMEELALSHIINAEGEKLQYILGTLGTGCCREPDVDEILAVNQSVANVLDSVSQNQMLLKSKMDKALQALSSTCPHRGEASCKCSAALKTTDKCRLWRAGTAICWDSACVHGDCIRFEPCEKTKLEICKKGRYSISFAVNIKAKACNKQNAAVCLQMTTRHKHKELYTVHGHAPFNGSMSTISAGGVIVEVGGSHVPAVLTLKLHSPELLIEESAMLNVVEI